MKKIKIVLLIVMMLGGLLLLTGCTTTTVDPNINTQIKPAKRFIRLYDEKNFSVYYDSETKVEYAVSTGYYNYGTMTVLVDSEGKPLLYEE